MTMRSYESKSKRRVRVFWEPRDMWLGIYRDPANHRLYICLLPCLPIVIERTA